MMNTIVTVLIIAAVIVVLYILFKIFKLITRLLLIAIFLVLAYLTNPGLEKHQQAVEKKAERTNTKLRGRNVSVSDFKIFSLTKISDDDHNKVVGAGLFTKVWIFRALD
jgi:ABC-type multidrug transport system fused ATPase/permease subunit